MKTRRKDVFTNFLSVFHIETKKHCSYYNSDDSYRFPICDNMGVDTNNIVLCQIINKLQQYNFDVIFDCQVYTPI